MNQPPHTYPIPLSFIALYENLLKTPLIAFKMSKDNSESHSFFKIQFQNIFLNSSKLTYLEWKLVTLLSCIAI